jgi:uncharacterized delta-60 repeat protein
LDEHSVTPSAAVTPGAISFTKENFSVNEGDGSVNITLTRTGGTDNKIVAKVNLTDATTSPADYRFAPGSLDTSFTPTTSSASPSIEIYTTAVQPDGKIIIGGLFTTFKGTPRNCIARLNADGSLDTSFNPGLGTNFSVISIAVQTDGKILIGGGFSTYNGIARSRVARLNVDGSLDTSFNPGTGTNDSLGAYVGDVVLQADGRIVISGNFTSYNGIARNRVARLNADGSLDTTFNPGTGANGEAMSISKQADGKIIIGGTFTRYNNVSRNYVARLNIDGSLDMTFDPGLGADESIFTTAVQADGKVIIGGVFGLYNGIARNRIARLNSDGSLDTSFNSYMSMNSHVKAMAIQEDGKIVVGGSIRSYQDTIRDNIARLNTDGSLDTSFTPDTGTTGTLFTVTIQGDGKIVIGGSISGYHDPRNVIARLQGDYFITWLAGDDSDKSISLPIIEDSILEPNETLTLSVNPLSGGAMAGSVPTTTLTIIDNDTSISAISGTGIYNGTASLQATLASFSSNLSGKTLTFTLNGVPVGAATTDSNGLATITGVSLSGINTGTYANAVSASFAGDTDYTKSSNSGPLIVSKATPFITWDTPANMIVGTALSNTQLNATASVSGTFQYTPPAGTMLAVGTYELSVTFNPSDTVNFNSVTRSVQLVVVRPPLHLILEESETEPNQNPAAAIDATSFLRDPFPIINIGNLLNPAADQNTRVIIFVSNLQLAQNEPFSSVVVHLTDAHGINYEAEAEDVRLVPLFDFIQVRFRLPDNLAPGTCTIKVKAHGQESNSGTIRIKG